MMTTPAKRMSRLLLGSLAALAAATSVPTTVLSQAPTIVRVDAGELEGVVADGVTSYKGIPFAAPPVGELRWRPPQPAARWAGVRQAAEFGPSCMQGRFGGPPPGAGARGGTPPAQGTPAAPATAPPAPAPPPPAAAP